MDDLKIAVIVLIASAILCLLSWIIDLIKRISYNSPRNKLKRINQEHKQEIDKIRSDYESKLSKTNSECKTQILKYQNANQRLSNINNELRASLKQFESNTTAIPYVAGMVADLETYGLERLALGLSWGKSQKRLEKVKSIREIRKDARAMVEKNKEAQYQLAYLLELYPNLTDIIECEFKNLPAINVDELSDYDNTRDYLSKEEYAALSTTERNQLALDRYFNSHNKSKWQIGRDYEQYVGHQYRQKGYDVDDCGTYMGLEDLGRDIIAKKGDITLVVQCKYWSSIKQIHEKHVTQLYGTMISYCIENNIDQSKVKGVLITNIQLSDMAKKMAKHLGIVYKENYAMGTYPCIKCNIGHSSEGATKIYHLPFDQQYDITKISKPGEFYAMTVAEAEAAGFRRTFKWFGNK